MIRLLLCLLLSFPAFSAVVVEMHFSTPAVKQGQLAEARIQIQNGENFKVNLLKGKTIGKTVYFYDVSPLIKRQGTEYLEATGKVIFIKVPNDKSVQETVSGEEINLLWDNVIIEPTVGEKSLIFGDFTIPEKFQWIFWPLIVLLSLGVLGAIGWKVAKRVRLKSEKKNRRLAMKKEILGCRNYDDVVSLWMKKHLLLEEYPHIREAFHKMEEVLNRHQFKPRQSEAEKIEVVESYRKFTRSVEGGFNGI